MFIDASNGRSMFRPIEWAPLSRAPRFAAAMMPGPPPVMIAKPASPSVRATVRASSYSGWSSGVRAEPKIETAAPTLASASKPIASSASIRWRRAVSDWVETIERSSAPSSSSSRVAGRRGRGSSLTR